MFEDLMRAGWPALEEVLVDGWVVRLSGGVTQRANSVLPIGAPADRRHALARTEALYGERGLPTVFQVGADARPAGLDEVLAGRGYVLGSPTATLTARIGDVPPVPGVALAESPDQVWLDLWWAVDGRGNADALALAVKIMTAGPAVYATVRDRVGAAAVGRMALVGEWGGVYCMAVRPDVRGRGLGAAILGALLAGGRERGVRRSWLHVRAENTVARRLYQRAGYTEAARYHYRTLAA